MITVVELPVTSEGRRGTTAVGPSLTTTIEGSDPGIDAPFLGSGPSSLYKLGVMPGKEGI